MKNFRKVAGIVAAPIIQMGHINLRQALPVGRLEQVSPFILLHHFDITASADEHDFNVPPHPHRGFSPVTFIFNGAVQHRDSLGNDFTISDNEVQWINAGRGIIHGEKVGREFAAKGGRFQGIQLWINTPKAHKMDPPSYQPITKEEIVIVEKNAVQFRLVSGTYDNKKGPAHSDVITGTMSLAKDAKYPFSFPGKNNVAIYLLQGKLSVNENEIVSEHELVYFDPSEGDIFIQGLEQTEMLVMSGLPINEPLVTHGPFVMNSQTEILEAMRDFSQNKMGFLY